MQSSNPAVSKKPGKKNTGRKGDGYESNATPSLRLMIKRNPDAGYIQRATSTITSWFNNPVPTKFDPEADSAYVTYTLTKIAAKLKPLQTELAAIEEKIKELKKNKQDIDPRIFANQTRLRREIDALQVEQVTGLAENIREHSARRIDLFFMLLIAVYKQNVEVMRAVTAKQHGSGSEKTMTAGCHHSLFPCLKFKTIPATIAGSVYSSVFSMFKSDNLFPPSPNGEQILEGTHFAEMLNNTAKLPVCVNTFDCHMERNGFETSSLVDIALGILNRCSRGIINPLQGLDEFCDALYAHLSALHTKYIKPEINYDAKGTRGKAPRSFALVWQYEREGALRNMRLYDVGDTKHAAAQWNYVYWQLGMQKLPASERVLSYVYSGPIEKRIAAIQQEIFKWKYDPKNTAYKAGKIT